MNRLPKGGQNKLNWEARLARTIGRRIHTHDAQRAGRDRRDGADHPHRGRLAGAVRAEKTDDLARSGLAEKSLKIGDKAPDFDLPNANGKSVRLSDLLQKGPVVVAFYRGGWCPFCNLELRALRVLGRGVHHDQDVEGIGLDIDRYPARTPDSADQGHIVDDAQPVDQAGEGDQGIPRRRHRPSAALPEAATQRQATIFGRRPCDTPSRTG